MSVKERRKLVFFDRVEHKQLTLKQAAQALGLSYRQTSRSYQHYCANGAEGLVHKSRGRPSNRAREASFKKTVIARYRDCYNGFGPTLAAEKLEADGFTLDHETLRRWLLAAGLWHKSRKRRQHRQRRKRRAHFGELVQMDGSHHRWFGPQHNSACLINMVDDATGTSLAVMAHEETTADCMRALMLWITTYGVPRALYVDRKSVFVTKREATLKEQLAGKKPMTVFGTACDKLGIQIIAANSPQAKGRVERSHGVYQDRFVKELRLKHITTVEQADTVLTSGFTDHLNHKFAVKPAHMENFHQKPPRKAELTNILCFEQTRVLQNDWTVHYHNRILQVLKTNTPLPRPKQKITVREHLDGSITLWDRNQKLSYKQIPDTPQPVMFTPTARKPTPTNSHTQCASL